MKVVDDHHKYGVNYNFNHLLQSWIFSHDGIVHVFVKTLWRLFKSYIISQTTTLTNPTFDWFQCKYFLHTIVDFT